ncbi:DNA repair endonuclease XPF [Nymphon striatum]|nr:DNA repair endonuclease XPF [Nymphon striatum]
MLSSNYRGLGVENVLVSLVKLYSDPINLVLVIGTSSTEEEFVHSCLVNEQIKHLPRKITAENTSNTRHDMYMEGGVLFVTSRILVVDMLTDKVPIDLISGIIVYKAHKIVESCQEAFILRMYKQKNKTGFVKALSQSPFSFTTGFCQVSRVMKNLFVGALYLWPRFHGTVQATLDKDKPEVIELQVKMTDAMRAIQMALLDLMSVCVKEIRRINPSISLNRKSLVDAKIPRSRQVLTLAAQSKESVTKIEPLYAVDSTVLFMRISVLLERSGNEIENYFRYELMPEPTSLFKENFMRTK